MMLHPTLLVGCCNRFLMTPRSDVHPASGVGQCRHQENHRQPARVLLFLMVLNGLSHIDTMPTSGGDGAILKYFKPIVFKADFTS